MAVAFGQPSVGMRVGGQGFTPDPSNPHDPARVEAMMAALKNPVKIPGRPKPTTDTQISTDPGAGSVTGSAVASSGGGGLAELEPMAAPSISALQNRTPSADAPPMMFQARPGPPGTNPNLGQRMPPMSMRVLQARAY